jgi:hypothetical protein
VEVGDLVKLKKGLNYSPESRDILGIITGKHQITSASTENHGIKEEYLATEYQVNIITNNKTAWYIDDSLELVNDSRRLGET